MNHGAILTLILVVFSVIQNDLWQFDPMTLKWTELNSSSHAISPEPRYEPGFESVNGVLYLYGGSHRKFSGIFGKQMQLFSFNLSIDTVGFPHVIQEYFSDLYAFDLKKMSWTDLTKTVSSFPTPRYAFSMTVYDGKLFLFGGKNGDTLTSGILVSPYCVRAFFALD